MSMCEGKVYCKIYKDKTRCSKWQGEVMFDCRHARRLCEVGYCAFEAEKKHCYPPYENKEETKNG